MVRGVARVSEHLSEIEEADLPPAHAMRCPGRRPLTAKPRIATKSRFWTRRRIGRVALCVGVALALAILFVLPGLADAQDALTAEDRELVELTARAANLAYREHQAYETFFVLTGTALRAGDQAVAAHGTAAVPASVLAARAQEDAASALATFVGIQETATPVQVEAWRQIDAAMDEKGRPPAWCAAWQLVGHLRSLDALATAMDDTEKAWADFGVAGTALTKELESRRISPEAALSQHREYLRAAIEAHATVVLLLEGRADNWDLLLVAVVDALVPEPSGRVRLLEAARAQAETALR